MSSYLLIIIARENPILVGILYKEKNITKFRFSLFIK